MPSAGMSARIVGVANNDQPLPVRDFGPASYRAYFDAIVPGNGKYMALLFNASTTYDVQVQRIYCLHNNITAAVGVVLEQSILRVSAFTSGTPVTPVAFDPADTLPASISADTNSSAVSDVANSTLERFITTGEELVLASTDVLLNSRSGLRGALVYEAGAGLKPIVLHGATAAQRGIAIKNTTNSSVGSLSYIIDFNVIAL